MCGRPSSCVGDRLHAWATIFVRGGRFRAWAVGLMRGWLLALVGSLLRVGSLSLHVWAAVFVHGGHFHVWAVVSMGGWSA